MFPRQHGPLALDAPVIAAKVAVAAQHPVAGNQPGDRIRAHRLADCAARAGAADRLGKRNHPIMATFAKNLSQDDIGALAEYFSRQSGLETPRRDD